MNTPSPAADPQFAAFIGLDWADQKHAWALQVAGSSRIEQGEVENTPEAMDAWVTELTQRFHCQPIAIALEQSRGNVIAKLVKYGNLVLYPINPKSSAAYRSTFHLSGAKSDPEDAVLLLELLTRHRDRLRALDPDTVETRMLRILVELRRDLVNQQTAYTQQLKDLLKQIFPQALQWLDKLHTAMACDFLQRWPTLETLLRARAQTVREFFQKHNSRNAERIEERIEQRKDAKPATEDRALLEPGIMMIQCLTKLLDQLRPSIEEFDAKIKAVYEAHPDFAIMQSFPGAGAVMGPRLVATVGSDRKRYASAVELQCFTGIAPVTVTSGQQEWIHWRWACSKFDRQTIHEWAGHSMKKCEWARQYYEGQRAKGKGHHAAVRGLGYKWLRILYRCWKDRTPYDEARYLESRGRHQSGTAKKSTGPVNILFKSCGGFSRPTAIST
jgi:transposase